MGWQKLGRWTLPRPEAPLRVLVRGRALQSRGVRHQSLLLQLHLVGFVLCIQPGQGSGQFVVVGGSRRGALGRGRCELTASLPTPHPSLSCTVKAKLSALPPFSRVSAFPPGASHP